jgi:hypothetical protein
MKKTKIMNRKPPQSGAVTHHHDQVMTSQSFRVMKIRNVIGRIGK